VGDRKEMYFWTKTRGEELDLFWYTKQFPITVARRDDLAQNNKKSKTRRLNKITGEATPGYLLSPDAPIHMSKSLPGAKLIVIMRNPIEVTIESQTSERMIVTRLNLLRWLCRCLAIRGRRYGLLLSRFQKLYLKADGRFALVYFHIFEY